MKAIFAVDYNLRTTQAWQKAISAPRATIERFFAWAKRYYKLKYFKVQGQEVLGRHVLAINNIPSKLSLFSLNS